MARIADVVSLLLVMTVGSFACGGEPAPQGGAAGEGGSAPGQAAPTQMPMSAPAGGAAALPEGVTQEMVSQGQQVFAGAGLCYTCHGPDGTGTPLAPNLTDVTWINVDGSYDAIVNLVKTGVAQPKEHPAPMPPMAGAQLTEDQVRAVAAFVYSRGHGG